jgi:hypothetical protein
VKKVGLVDKLKTFLQLLQLQEEALKMMLWGINPMDNSKK